MASQSYCVVENIAQDLPTMLRVLKDHIRDDELLNSYELNELPQAIELMKSIIELYDSNEESFARIR